MGSLAALLAAAVLAQGAPAPDPADQAVATYPAAFFASAQPVNAMDMVDRLPGFSFDEGGSVRGLSGAAGNVLIDGRRPASKSDALGDVLGRIPAGQVLRIDVIRGGAPGIDMQRKPVVANIIRDPRGGISGAVEVSDNLRLGAGGRNEASIEGDVSARLGVRVFEASFEYDKGDDSDHAHTDRRRVDQVGRPILISRIDADRPGSELAATAALETPLPIGGLRLDGRYYRDIENITERDDFDLPEGLGVLREAYRGKGGELTARYIAPLAAGAELEVTGLKSWRSNTKGARLTRGQNLSGFDRYDDSGELVGRALVRLQRWETISFEGGLEAAVNRLEGDSILVVDGVPTQVPGSQAEVRERRGEGFVTGVWQAAPTLSAEAGLRVEVSRFSPRRGLENQFQFAKPSAALTWNLSPASLVRARVEREIGQLNFNDFVAEASITNGSVTAGSVDLAPTQTIRAELAFEQQFWERGALVAAIRRERLEDIIDRAPTLGVGGLFDQRRNIGPGRRDILEINSTLPLDGFGAGLPGVLLKGWIKAVRSELTDPTTGEKRRFSDQAALEWNASVTHDLPGWNASWGVDVSGASEKTVYRFDRTETWEAEPWVSAYVDYNPRPDLSLRFELNNLTARSVWNLREVHSGPRHASDLSYVERRDEQSYRNVRLSLRKSFN